MADERRDPLGDAALAAAYRARRPSGAHLTESQWEQLTCDEMSRDDRDRALAHIVSCADCSTIHRSLIELRAGAAQIENARPSIGMSYRRWTIVGGLATAAAIVLALVINRPTRVDPDVLRSAGEKPTVTLVSPLPDALLGENRTFAWQPVDGADRYELRVTTSDGRPILTSNLDQTSTQLPNDVKLAAGEYFWQVVAMKGDATIAASPIRQFNSGITLR